MYQESWQQSIVVDLACVLQRVVRGILCDVWAAERGVKKGQYYTVEVYFSHENWTVEVEVFNKARQVPIAISSYVADAVSRSGGSFSTYINCQSRDISPPLGSSYLFQE